MINVNILFFTIELILFLLSSFVCVFPKKREQIQTGITLSESLCLRGISIGVIIFSHLIQFSNIITTVHWLKILFVPFMHITYVFVALFFFLSGYGNYLSIKKSVNKWSWLNKRVVTLFVFFIPGFMVNIFINKASYSTTKEIIFDLFTFTYKPYSLWFFKVIFIFYLLSFIVSLLFKEEKMASIIFIITVLYILICFFYKVSDYWWSSVIAYPLGIFFANKKDCVVIKKIISHKNCLLLLFLTMITLILTCKIVYLRPLTSVLFCLFITLYVNLFEISRFKILNIVGKCSLGIYLYHTILITVFSNDLLNVLSTSCIFFLSFTFSFLIDFFISKIGGKK